MVWPVVVVVEWEYGLAGGRAAQMTRNAELPPRKAAGMKKAVPIYRHWGHGSTHSRVVASVVSMGAGRPVRAGRNGQGWESWGKEGRGRGWRKEWGWATHAHPYP